MASGRKAGQRRNVVRIIGGAWRGRLLRFPDSEGLRPTGDRIRETLFNWLGQELRGKHCLDLYAGSGVLGFEAASRGAARVTLVERSRGVAQSLTAAIETLRATQVEVRCCDALEFLAWSTGGARKPPSRQYDVVFLDPPFGGERLLRSLIALEPWLASGASVYLESDAPLTPGPTWQIVKQSRAGAVHYGLVQKVSQLGIC
ncbi:MAG: 16S rRNA (guanine(966)-N(2))-methyltransferase RsmD [Burkholderiales bacterium]